MAIHNADTIHTTLSPEAQKAYAKDLLARHRRNLKVTTISMEACEIDPSTPLIEVPQEKLEEYARMRKLVLASLLKYESEVQA